MAARQAKARAVFEVMADARLGALASGKPMNAKLGLPYLASRYDELTALLQLQPLCAKASGSWREDENADTRGSGGGEQAEV
jgi:hypothetical protein